MADRRKHDWSRDGRYLQNKTIRNQFAVTRDGRRFLLLSVIDRDASPFVTVVNRRALVRN
jgi:hypothetical protein